MGHPQAAFPSPVPCVLAFFDPACLGWAVDGIYGLFGEHVGKGWFWCRFCFWCRFVGFGLGVFGCRFWIWYRFVFFCFFFTLPLVVMLIDACYCRGTFTYIPKEPSNYIPDTFEMWIVVVSRNTYQS